MTLPTIVIPAAGENSRFFPLNTTTHKGGLSLLGKPLILRVLENLQQHSFTKVIIVVSAKDEGDKGLVAAVKDAVKNTTNNAHLDMNIQFATQTSPKGAGDAILAAKDLINKNSTSNEGASNNTNNKSSVGNQNDIAIIHPYYFNAGEILTQMVRLKKEKGANGVLLGTVSENPSLEGILKLDGDRVIGVVEKPAPGSEPSQISVKGVYLFDHEFLDELEKTPAAEYAFETAYTRFAEKNHVTYLSVAKELLPPSLKYPWRLFAFQDLLFKQQQTVLHPKAMIASTAVIDDTAGAVVVEEGARIGHAAHIVGPCYIGRNAVVGSFSLMRESSLEEGSSIGAYTDLARSIVLQDTKFHNAYIADSIIGSHVRIGAGMITANKRLDRANIMVDVKGKRVDSGTNGLGVIIGDKSNLGIGVKTMPGVCIGNEAVIYPGVIVKANIGHKGTVKWDM